MGKIWLPCRSTSLFFCITHISLTAAAFIVKDAKDRCLGHVVTNKQDKEGNVVYNDTAIEAIYNIIEWCKERGSTPILLTTSFTKEYNDQIKTTVPEFYKSFHELLENISKETDVKYYDYSEDERFITNYELFMNSDHLNREGAKIFTEILLKENLDI